MSRSALMLALAAVLATVLAKPAEDRYTTRYDGIDLDAILRNDRLFNKYVECLLNQDSKGCTAEGKELRESLPDALTNDCSKCSEKQAEGAHKIIKFVSENKPEVWKNLQAKYDPEGLFVKRYAEHASEHGVSVEALTASSRT